MRALHASLLGVACLLTSCGHGSDTGSSCGNATALERTRANAQLKAASDPAMPQVESCSEVDAPSDGLASSPGLTAAEYAGLLHEDKGNFFDDGTWWLKAAPRGETHVEPLDVVAENCQQASFESFNYDYASATPPLSSAPECGRYLVAIQAGHRIGKLWPQLLSLEGSGLVRLAPLRTITAFGSYLRVPGGLPADDNFQSHVTQVNVIRHDENTLELVALAEALTFTAAIHLTFTAGQATRLKLELDIFLRGGAPPPSDLSLGALTGTFRVGGGNVDFDQLTAAFSDGTSRVKGLADVKLDDRDPAWRTTSVGSGGASLSAFALVQGARAPSQPGDDAASSAERPDMTVSDIHSDVPLTLALSLTSQPELDTNVSADLVMNAEDAGKAASPIHVSYQVTASLP